MDLFIFLPPLQDLDSIFIYAILISNSHWVSNPFLLPLSSKHRTSTELLSLLRVCRARSWRRRRYRCCLLAWLGRTWGSKFPDFKRPSFQEINFWISTFVWDLGSKTLGHLVKISKSPISEVQNGFENLRGLQDLVLGLGLGLWKMKISCDSKW